VRTGILLLDKPLGLSSNAALQRVRRLLGAAKAGHVGSLDPLATGMLPICLEEATKIAGDILAGRKCYRFSIGLGTRTATGDAEGRSHREPARCRLCSACGYRARARAFRGRQRRSRPCTPP
jgi:tRNA pseudouridine55 synthase